MTLMSVISAAVQSGMHHKTIMPEGCSYYIDKLHQGIWCIEIAWRQSYKAKNNRKVPFRFLSAFVVDDEGERELKTAKEAADYINSKMI